MRCGAQGGAAAQVLDGPRVPRHVPPPLLPLDGARGERGGGGGGGEEQTRERESEAERERGAPRVDLAFFCLAFSGCWQLLAIVDKKKTRCRVRLF